MDTLTITDSYVPGTIGRIAEMHARYYARHWGFGLFFESKVATGLTEFLQRFDPGRDGIWTAAISGRIEGSIAIDGAHADSAGAHLRWFIVSERMQGRKLGQRLFTEALSFCAGRSYPKVYLWTFEGLDSARHLYESAGFRLVDQFRGSQWGPQVTEQRFELEL